MESSNTTPSRTVLQAETPLRDRILVPIAQHWILAFSMIYGIYVFLPFLAPVFMHFEWYGPGKAIYFIYSFLCHQLPQRSFFLFGPKMTYSIAEIQQAGGNASDFLLLRQFIGSSQLGWKVAWSDRMVSMFTSIWVFGLLWGLFRRKIPKLSWWAAILFILPLAVDGTTHLISDLGGLRSGFRDSNAWLAALTHNAFQPTFYAGDALGSFNSTMRIITGILFGLGIVWFSFPYLNLIFDDIVHSAKARLKGYSSSGMITL